MRKAIFTIMIGGDPAYACAYRTFQRYAKKVGADLVVSTTPHYALNKKKLACKVKHAAWFEKIYILELLKEYDRVLYLDADILITPSAPDIFSFYPDDSKIYMLNEGFYANRDKQIHQILSFLSLDKPWEKAGDRHVYCNSGVMLISRKANLFEYVNQDELLSLLGRKVSMYEQTYFNYLIMKYDLDRGDLQKEFNRLSLFGEENYLDSYFIHYAGGGFCTSSKRRYKTMIKDYQTLYREPSSRVLRWLEIRRADLQFLICEIKKSIFKWF